MTANFLTYFFVSKKYVLAIFVVLTISFLPVRAQIKYVPSDERRESGMGVERVAMLFTATYESKVAKNDKEIRWIQLDLGEKKKIDGIKLLPRINIRGSFVSSVGFPLRFKIEVSDDPEFKVSIMYQDQTRADFKDPYDEVCTFSGKEVNTRYVRLTAVKLRQQRLALTKIMIMSDGKEICRCLLPV